MGFTNFFVDSFASFRSMGEHVGAFRCSVLNDTIQLLIKDCISDIDNELSAFKGQVGVFIAVYSVFSLNKLVVRFRFPQLR